MHHFEYRDDALYCEGVALAHLAETYGTPLYVYSTATLKRHFSVLSEAFSNQACLIAYSVKANSNLGVLATLSSQGAGADVVSAGELFRALKVGIPAEKIVFSGVGKSSDEIRIALEAGIHQFNVESVPEMRRLSQIASEMGVKAPLALRVNPHVAAGGHANISTGKAEDKFGIAWHEAKDIYKEALTLPGLSVVGVDVHIGSQIVDIAPMREAFVKVVELVKELRELGCPIERLDFGGGLGIPYKEGDAPDSPAKYAQMVKELVQDLDVEVILEPGRMIAGNAGVFLSRVEYIKERDGRNFAIIDAGMNDLMRPALYQAVHEVKPVAKQSDAPMVAYDLVGPICESTDRFAKDYSVQALQEGDLIAFMSAGAYGAVMSNQYNTRPLCAEVLVDGDRYDLVRRVPTYEEMLKDERVPDWIMS